MNRRQFLVSSLIGAFALASGISPAIGGEPKPTFEVYKNGKRLKGIKTLDISISFPEMPMYSFNMRDIPELLYTITIDSKTSNFQTIDFIDGKENELSVFVIRSDRDVYKVIFDRAIFDRFPVLRPKDFSINYLRS